MARLPQPGADAGSWGEILNDYLSQVHAADGSLKTDTVGASQLKPNSVTAAAITDATVTEAKLGAGVQAKLNTPVTLVDGSVTNAKLADGVITDAKVAAGAAIAQDKIASLTTDLAAKLPLSQKATVNGVASLDATTKVPIEQIPIQAIADDTVFVNTIGLESPQNIARRLLAQSPAGISEHDLATVVPTVSLGTSGAGPTISGGVRVSPKRLSSTVIDVLGDPHYEYVGIIPGRLQVSSGDMTYADYLAGGSSQNARNRGRYRTVFTGQVFEVYLRARGTSIGYRLYVNGRPVTTALQSLTVDTSSRYYMKVDMGSAATWQITLEIVDPEFGGFVIGPTDSIRRPERGMLLAGMGDSHTSGANGVSWLDTWVRRSADALGSQYANIAIGGSGYLNATTQNFRNRLTTDLFPLAPDVVVLEGSWNDSSATEPELQAEAAYVFDAVRAALPHALLIAAGPWVTSHNLSSTLDAHDATLRTQAQASGWNGYISYRDPMNLKAVSPAWAATTVYGIGDVVVFNGFAQLCVTAHTSGVSWDQTKWRSTAMVGGTGRVGATTGNGNADVLVSNDTVHGTALAHSVKAGLVTAAIKRIARAVASGADWAS